MTVPHRETRELRVMYHPGLSSNDEQWFFSLAQEYSRATMWQRNANIKDMLGRLGPCMFCAVPPVRGEYGFYYRLVHPSASLNLPTLGDRYEWRCLDCAYEDIMENFPYIIASVGEPPESAFITDSGL